MAGVREWCARRSADLVPGPLLAATAAAACIPAILAGTTAILLAGGLATVRRLAV
jgi:hypothetical protein